jgi:hypothetical protein
MDPQLMMALGTQFQQLLGAGADAVDPKGTNYGAQWLKGSSGGLLGVASSLIATKRRRKEEYNQTMNTLNQERLMAQSKPVDPIQVQGFEGSNYYRSGGQLLPYKAMSGGSMSPLNSEAVEIQGNSHEQGGVQLDNGAEVEGNETISEDYVFSDQLGFAALHKPIAKAIGQIEQKPVTEARKNSLILLKDKENRLKQLQELVKSQL